jgi:hypothetical protein
MSETCVVNKRKEAFDVYIGRGSPFGNPFVIGPHGDRAAVIEAYRQHLKVRLHMDPAFHHKLMALKGKRLGCFCAPEACHGDVIKQYIESANV